MTRTTFPQRLPWTMAAGALLAVTALLVGEHLHGGVATHNLMRSATMPGLSNFWGLVLIPALAFWAGGRIARRLAAGTRPATVLAGAALALLLGLALSAAFSAGHEDLTAAIFAALLLLGVVLPGHRAECWLGFVLGMGVTFGTVIPTVIGGIVAGVSLLVHRVAGLLRRRWRAAVAR